MQSLVYDANVAYDSPYYVYDGFPADDTWLDLKTAIDRELRFGGILEGLLSADRVDLDMRMYYSTAEAPFLSFERIIGFENNQVRHGRERFLFHVCVKPGQEDLADAIVTALKNAMGGAMRRWGQFDAEGNPKPLYGPVLRSIVVATSEQREDDLIGHRLTAVFSYVR